MSRWKVVAALAAAGVVMAGGAAISLAGRAPRAGGERGSLQLFYTGPVLVRAGETVRVPVDAVCVLPGGTACRATVAFGVRTGPRAWQREAGLAAPGLAFDLTGPARRAVTAGAGAGSSGEVTFYLGATGPGDLSAWLPAEGPAAPLAFYVVPRVSVMAVPRPSESRRGRTVLALPWGTGRVKAGLIPGNESPTEGPAAFDVGLGGEVYVLDGPQHRLAVFRGGRFVRQTELPHDATAWDVAVAGDRTAAVLSRGLRGLTVTTIDGAGRMGGVRSLGDDIPGRIRMVDRVAYVHILPLDAWVRAADPVGLPTTGQPLPGGGQLLSVVRGEAVRLGAVTGGVGTDARELRFGHPVGEFSLCEPDGTGGYVVVVRFVSGSAPIRGYQAVHILGGGGMVTFTLPAQEFAQASTLSRFRLGPDGALYQLLSSPRGMRIVRYDLKGDR